MKRILFLLFFMISFVSTSQNTEGTELGLDGTFYASNLGGTVGLGAKYGWKFGEFFIAGPSVRYQRSWSQIGINTASPQQTSFNVFGGGGFIHARFFNALFVGAELELLRGPYLDGNLLTGQGTWAPTAFLGGGFSMEINEKWRLNLGIMYDVIDSQNSPLRTQYFMRNSLNQLLPIIYRISFFFPIG